jgi:hypothetical protein
MKLSKSLLQAMAVGITLGVSAASCSKSDEYNTDEDHICVDECELECELEGRNDEGHVWNCGPCGMG